MRVRIKGEVTLEQLAEALNKAATVCESVRPGFKFYGADLYIRPFDADGVPFDVAGRGGNQLVITVPVPPGGLAKPALTANGQARIDSQKEMHEREKEANDALMKKRDEEAAAHWRKLDEERKRKRANFKRAVGLTSTLMKNMPERFIASINGAIRSAWDKHKPVDTKGRNKGHPKPMPFFGIQDNALFVFCENVKHPRKVSNPMYRNDDLALMWNNDAWKEAAGYIAKSMLDLENEIPKED